MSLLRGIFGRMFFKSEKYVFFTQRGRDSLKYQMAKVTPSPSKLPPHEETYHISAQAEQGGERTFQREATLPSLPLPTLEHTLDQYLESVRPHLTEEEYRLTKDEVERFAAGVGPRLHASLQQRQARSRNWLEDWWLHYAYLTHRQPLLPTLNVTGLHPLSMTIWPPRVEKAFEYGSLYLWAFLEFNRLLREERLKPHVTKEGRPLSMEQFRWMFNCTRIPGQAADSLRWTFKTKSEGKCPMHVVALCKGHIWLMYPWDCDGQQLTPPELEAQLRHTWDSSEALGPGPSVAALTCDKRDVWAENRDWLKSLSLNNMRILDLIETSVLVFVLDESMPKNFDELLWEGLCGDVGNRWADKSLSVVVTRNGYGAANTDHTPFEAMVSVMMGHYQHLLLTHMGGKWTGRRGVRAGLPQPTRISFDLDGKMLKAIDQARETNRAYTSDVAVRPFFFTEYGRDFLRPHKLHPDSYIQMALQLTFLRVHGRPAPTYETASTRQFYHGRTETIRSCTTEAIDWARTMLDPKALVAEKKRKLTIAVEKHNELRNMCEKNEGVDRHLLGLYITALEAGEEIPGLFTDPAFVKSGGGGNYMLVTSTVGSIPVVGGVSAKTTHGYGCYYNMQPDKLAFFISHFKSSGETDFDTFTSALTTTLREMRQVLEAPKAAH